LKAVWAPSADVRAETWALGARHRGEVIQGAQLELRAPGVTSGRARLLRAVIRHRRRLDRQA
jgi:hypothetical protein